ncbi:hypothetical protein D3C73_1267180 [compost metagenome]
MQLGVARVFPQALLDTRQPGFVLPLVDQLGGFLVGHLRRTARGQRGAQAKAHQQTVCVHGALPTDKVWDKCIGR